MTKAKYSRIQIMPGNIILSGLAGWKTETVQNVQKGYYVIGAFRHLIKQASHMSCGSNDEWNFFPKDIQKTINAIRCHSSYEDNQPIKKIMVKIYKKIICTSSFIIGLIF